MQWLKAVSEIRQAVYAAEHYMVRKSFLPSISGNRRAKGIVSQGAEAGQLEYLCR